MSLPLGHLAIGMTAYDFCSDNVSVFRHWRTAALVAVLANLPDIDMIFGLILQGNGSAFHRGPTHSIVFALLMSLLAANGWKLLPRLPKIGFSLCFIIVLSHLLADFFFSGGQVSFFWPLAVGYSDGYQNLGNVVYAALQVYEDLGIIMGCSTLVICRRLVGADLAFHLSFGKLPAIRSQKQEFRR